MSERANDIPRDLVDAIVDALCVLEVLLDDSGRVVDVRYVCANPAFAAHTGVADVTGRTASEAFPPALAERLKRIERVWRSGEPSRFVGSPDAHGRRFEVSLSRIGDVAARHVACQFKDVTREHEDRERALEMAAELAETDRRKTEFLATLAHELRNPLAPILSGLELLDSGGVDPAEFARVHRMLARQVGQMTRLVDALLDLSRISQDRIELQRAPVALVDIVDGAVEACRPMLEQRSHSLTIERPAADVVIDVDAVRLIQVLSNLLNNAVAYTPSGGHIAVSTAVDEDGIRLSVGDDGNGLDAESLEHVFEMFARVPGETPREHGGLGIGLPLSRRLVELHGGRLVATSDGPGRGSRFDVRLPVTSCATVTIEPAGQAEARVPRSLHVLIVDDNRDAADTLARLLARRGHDTSIAYCGRDALEAVDDVRPDVVLLDIGLPDITGYQVAVELHAKALSERVVLVALTGWGTAADRRRSRDAGFEHHLTKPVSARRVLELLDGIANARAIA